MKSAQQTVAPAADAQIDLSLNEMLRVMDVARELRNDRQAAEQVLARGDARAALRDKLIRSAQLSGDSVTAAEVDVAIDTYFENRHRYQDPDLSPSVFLAHLWVRRTGLMALGAAALLALAAIWGLFFASFAPLSPTRNAQRAAATVNDEATQLVEQIRAVSLVPDAVASAERLAAEIQAAGTSDVTTAIAARDQLRLLHQQLVSAYQLRIARDADGASLISRGYRDSTGDIVSGYFVLVEAVDANGNVIAQQIRNAETGTDQTVKIWAERIPEDVYERLKQDKISDQVMNESEFGVKQRGRLELDVRIPNSEGNPIQRSIQITNW
jgi:hypothetical protein